VDPRVSVVIPTYNYGRFLPDALRSVAAQGIDDLEIIVVDDGSTDHTPSILAQWPDARLRPIRRENGGIMAARATGLAAVRGRFVAFLDADDLWRPGYLLRQLGVLAAEPDVGFCFTDFVRTSDGVELPESQFDHVPGFRDLPARAVSGQANAKALLDDAFPALAPLPDLPGWLQATVIRSEHVHHLRTRPGVTHGEDLYLMLQLYSRTRAAYIDQPLVEVRRHGGNSYGSTDEIREGVLEVVQLALEDFPLSARDQAVLRRRIGAEYLRRGWRHFWGHQPAAAAQYYRRAMAWPGTQVSALGHLAALPLLPLLPKREPKF
jgi:glycosyltransferase involved in cell wall biosynthesis